MTDDIMQHTEEVESPILEILMSGRPEDRKTCIEHEPWHLKIGDWATMIPELQYQTAVMSRRVLHYHAREQKHEKRLDQKDCSHFVGKFS